MDGHPHGAGEKYEQSGHRPGPPRESAPRRLRIWLRFCGGRHKFQNGSAHRIHRGHEAVSAARQRFYIARLIGRITERLAELIDRRVESMFEVTSRNSGPQAVAKLFNGHQVAGPLHQRVQNLTRL